MRIYIIVYVAESLIKKFSFRKYYFMIQSWGCIHYVYCSRGRGGGLPGGKRYFLRGKIFFISPHIIQRLLTSPLLTKRKNDTPPPPPVLMRKIKYRQYDKMVQRLMFKIEN